jgi:hypothetical protein
MRNLLYKEFHLAIHPLFYLVALFGLLLLIPQWLYFIALMYFFFIAVPNIFTYSKSQGDIAFSMSLPVRRSDIVKSRVMSLALLELLQIVTAAIFAVVNKLLYPEGNFLLDANIAFIGFVFMMYGLFNIVIFPMFYKTAYKIAGPSITAITVTVLFAAAVEMAVQAIPFARTLDGWDNIGAQVVVLILGIVLFILLSLLSSKISVKRFERVNI